MPLTYPVARKKNLIYSWVASVSASFQWCNTRAWQSLSGPLHLWIERIHSTGGSTDKPQTTVTNTFKYYSSFINLESCFEDGHSCSRLNTGFVIMHDKEMCIKIAGAHAIVFKQLQSHKNPRYSLNERKKNRKQKPCPVLGWTFCPSLTRKFRSVWYLEKNICVKENFIITWRESQILETIVSFSCCSFLVTTKIFPIPLRPDGFKF